MTGPIVAGDTPLALSDRLVEAAARTNYEHVLRLGLKDGREQPWLDLHDDHRQAYRVPARRFIAAVVPLLADALEAEASDPSADHGPAYIDGWCDGLYAAHDIVRSAVPEVTE